jgi:hypothetical protein
MAKAFAQRVGPLKDAIRKEIIDGNMEWRRVLNEEQKAQHDKDLAGMEKFFNQVDDQVERWSKGDVRREDITGRVSNGPVTLTKVEDSWDIRVRNFIIEYDLDPPQRQAALTILREMKDRAAKHRKRYAEEFAKIEAQFKQIVDSPPAQGKEEREKRLEKRRDLYRDYKEKEGEISGRMTRELLARLDKIPTAEQKRRREAHMAGLNKRSGTRIQTINIRPKKEDKPPSTQPADIPPPPSSRPASSG